MSGPASNSASGLSEQVGRGATGTAIAATKDLGITSRIGALFDCL